MTDAHKVGPEWTQPLDASAYGTSDISDSRIQELKIFAKAVQSLPAYSMSMGYRAISKNTLNIVMVLASRLPFNRFLPRVGCDEDGCVFMNWSELGKSCELTIEGDILHMVVNPGSNSTHIEPKIYNGGNFPPQFLVNIPERTSRIIVLTVF